MSAVIGILAGESEQRRAAMKVIKVPIPQVLWACIFAKLGVSGGHELHASVKNVVVLRGKGMNHMETSSNQPIIIQE